MSVKIEERQFGKVVMILIAGRMTQGDGSSTFRDKIQNLVARGEKRVLIDLREVSYIDATGVGELVSALSNITRRNGQLRLVNLTARVKQILEETNLYCCFCVYDDVEAALASFQE